MGPEVLRVPRVVRRDGLLGCLLECLDVVHLVLLALGDAVLLRHIERGDQTGVNGLAYQLDLVLLDIGVGSGRLGLLLEEGVVARCHVDIERLCFLLLG